MQQRALLQQTEEASAALSTARLLKRRAGSIASRRREARERYLAAARTLTESVLDSLAATCRKVRAAKPLTAPACGRLIADAPAPGTVVKQKRGNRFKHAPTIEAGKAGIAARRKDAAAAKVLHDRGGRSGRPLHRGARNRAEKLPAGVAVGQRKRRAPAASAQSKRHQPVREAAVAAALAVAAAEAAAEEAEGEEGMAGMEEDEESDMEEEGEQGKEGEEGEEGEEREEGEDEEGEEGGEGWEGVVDPARVARVERLAGLRRGLKIFEDRFRIEHARDPSGADCPYHIRDNYREYRELKAQLYKK